MVLQPALLCLHLALFYCRWLVNNSRKHIWPYPVKIFPVPCIAYNIIPEKLRMRVYYNPVISALIILYVIDYALKSPILKAAKNFRVKVEQVFLWDYWLFQIVLRHPAYNLSCIINLNIFFAQIAPSISCAKIPAPAA